MKKLLLFSISLFFGLSTLNAQCDAPTAASPLASCGGVATIPLEAAPSPVAVTYTLNMTDSWGDGWNGNEITIAGFPEIVGTNLKIPSDPSSAAFFITAACLRPGSKLIIKNMLYNKTRIGFIKTLKKMGAEIQVINKRKVNFEILADLKIDQKKFLKPTILEANDVPLQVDEIPILSIAASFAGGKSVFKGLKELTVKESNRLELVHQNLKNMGVKSEVKGFDLHIYGNYELKEGGAKIIHHHDHRIVMSFYIANLICIKNNVIKDKSSVKTSYPSFFKDTGKYFH